MDGGPKATDVTLVTGPSGVGKTILAALDRAGSEQGQHCLYVTFQDTPKQLTTMAGAFGWDIATAQESGRLANIPMGDLSLERPHDAGCATGPAFGQPRGPRRTASPSWSSPPRRPERFPAFYGAAWWSGVDWPSSLVTSRAGAGRAWPACPRRCGPRRPRSGPNAGYFAGQHEERISFAIGAKRIAPLWRLLTASPTTPGTTPSAWTMRRSPSPGTARPGGRRIPGCWGPPRRGTGFRRPQVTAAPHPAPGPACPAPARAGRRRRDLRLLVHHDEFRRDVPAKAVTAAHWYRHRTTIGPAPSGGGPTSTRVGAPA